MISFLVSVIKDFAELISDKYGDASRLIAEVEDYFTGRGGSVRFVGDMP